MVKNNRYTGFTLAEVLIAKRERGKMSLLKLSRTRELKAPSSRFLNQCAFTLAEVLITLGIIGIVAAMTIPTLVANYQKTQYVTSFKKAYTEITQALNLMANDNGCPGDLKCAGVFVGNSGFSNEARNIILGDEFKKYFKVVKDCGTTYNASDVNTKCFSDAVSDSYEFEASRPRYDWNSDNPGAYNFITASGVAISLSSSDCSTNMAEDAATNLALSEVCGLAIIDINGFKGPNNYGRDIFSLFITNGKGPGLYPNGGSEFDPSYNNPWKDGNGAQAWCYEGEKDGWECAGRIIEEDWQMKY